MLIRLLRLGRWFRIEHLEHLDLEHMNINRTKQLDKRGCKCVNVERVDVDVIYKLLSILKWGVRNETVKQRSIKNDDNPSF